MNRNAYFNSPFLLGFEHLERVLERTAKTAGDGYPPYNIEERGPEDRLRITCWPWPASRPTSLP